MSYANPSLNDGYIYCATNKKNNKKYVGQTITSIPRRWQSHISEAKSGVYKLPINHAILKYGADGFEVEEVEHIFCETKEELSIRLNELESHYIKQLSSKSPIGYNLTDGGDSSSSVRVRPVAKIDRFGRVLETYDSIANACRKNDIYESGLCSALYGFSIRGHGFYWKFLSDITIKNGFIENWSVPSSHLPIAQYDILGNLLMVYDTLTEASEKTGITTSRIMEVCEKKRHSCFSYMFISVKDPENIQYKISKYPENNINKVIFHNNLSKKEISDWGNA